MKAARSFAHDIYTEDFEIELKNLLHLSIKNKGTSDIIVENKDEIEPNGYFNIPPSGDVPMESQILRFKNVTKASVTKSYLIGKSC